MLDSYVANAAAVFSPQRRNIFAAWLLCCLIVVWCAPETAGQQQQRTKPSAPTSVPAKAGGTQEQFDLLVAQATGAREASRLDEAITLYRKALELRPQWAEGWWYLATILYDRDLYAKAVPAFEQAAALQPKVGAIWAMLGLCEYQVGRYDEALAHIQQALQLNLPNNPELSRSVRYHAGVLLNLKGEFESAQQTLSALSDEGVGTENLIVALGLSVLRLPMLPKDVTANDRELIRRAGWAEHLVAQKNIGDAQREYERLVQDFPKTANVQYAYGRFLLAQREDEKAVAAFQREIQNSPNHAMARFQIAYSKMNHKDATGGLEYASQAVKLNPRIPLGRYILGRLLFDTGQIDRAIEELEAAQHIAPNNARIYFTLSRAYARANRSADAERARATFIRLNQLEEAAREEIGSGESTPENTKPPPP
ncbi:hypothetical protein BH18ACI4_BH18ACI4_20140 [soil metagenome]